MAFSFWEPNNLPDQLAKKMPPSNIFFHKETPAKKIIIFPGETGSQEGCNRSGGMRGGANDNIATYWNKRIKKTEGLGAAAKSGRVRGF